MNKTAIIPRIFFVVWFACIIFIFVFMIVVPAYSLFSGISICKQSDFDYHGRTMSAEEGYVLCCNSVYVDHIEVEPDCKAVKVGD